MWLNKFLTSPRWHKNLNLTVSRPEIDPMEFATKATPQAAHRPCHCHCSIHRSSCNQAAIWAPLDDLFGKVPNLFTPSVEIVNLSWSNWNMTGGVPRGGTPSHPFFRGHYKPSSCQLGGYPRGAKPQIPRDAPIAQGHLVAHHPKQYPGLLSAIPTCDRIPRNREKKKQELTGDISVMV